ncbi:MAG: RNA 2',3'-cyclic phosphodiesterase [Candidatus Aenigmarchaeota archaeon]|nr:RNA 2',3'-cyclic phosphodiesterase [Candidatus Aenigmarchaeota archaeon]
MRLFLAVEIPLELRNEIYNLKSRIDDGFSDIKWVEKQNLHITLRFLGEVPERRLEEIEVALNNVEVEPFRCAVKSLGVFPNEKRPRVIWAGVEPQLPLKKMHVQLDRALFTLGFRKELGYRPHITLGRIKMLGNADELVQSLGKLKDFSTGEFMVDRFVLKRSTLTKDGPVYDDLMVFGL